MCTPVLGWKGGRPVQRSGSGSGSRSLAEIVRRVPSVPETPGSGNVAVAVPVPFHTFVTRRPPGGGSRARDPLRTAVRAAGHGRSARRGAPVGTDPAGRGAD